jgi:hypothetical protein
MSASHARVGFGVLKPTKELGKRRLAKEVAKEKRSVTNYVEVTLTAIWDQHAGQTEGSFTVHGVHPAIFVLRS